VMPLAIAAEQIPITQTTKTSVLIVSEDIHRV
jgi:hypothetical protein